MKREMTEDRKSLLHQDRGYAWVVCGAICIQRLLYGGVFNSIGMFYIMFTENLAGDSAILSFVAATNTATMFGVGPLAGFLISRFGGRTISIVGTLMSTMGLVLASQSTHAYQVCLSFGVLTGAGLGLQNVATFTVMSLYFDRWLGLASGLTAAATSTGLVLFPYLIRYFDDFYGWRGALIILGGIELQSLICGVLYFKPYIKVEYFDRLDESARSCKSTNKKKLENMYLEIKTNESDKKQDKHSHGSNSVGSMSNLSFVGKLKYFFSVFQTPAFSVFCGSEVCFMTAVSIVYTHIGAYTKYLGFTTDDVLLIFLIIGVAGIFAKVLAGLTTQIPKCDPLYICLSSLLLAVITSLISFFTTLPLLQMYAIFFGVLISPYLMLQVTIVKRIISIDKLTIAMGFILFFWAPAYLLGGPIAGWLFDLTGIYLYSFYLAAGFMFVAGILDVIAIWLNRKSTK